MGKRKFYFSIAGLICVLFVGAYIALHIGSVKIPMSSAYKIAISCFSDECKEAETKQDSLNKNSVKEIKNILEVSDVHKVIITELRFPRILAAILCGAALAVSGAAYQSMFVNPLVSPSLLGVLAGAAFGASFGMLISSNLIVAQIGAVIFGIVSVILTLSLARFFPGNRLIMIIMGGVISSTFFTALLSVVKYIADTQSKLPNIVYWLMGGFSSVNLDTILYCAPILTLCIFAVVFMSGYLNVLSLGDEEAYSLGINASLIRKIIIFVTTLCSSITVAIGGMIGWVGMMIPHIARMFVGHDNKKMILFSCLLGSIYLLIVDTLCRSLFVSEVPIGIVTSIIGIPFFVFTVISSNNRWN